jgi:hypothetical protein
MFYVDRLHKLVAAQCAFSDFLGNANALVLNMGARHDPPPKKKLLLANIVLWLA